MERKKRSKGSLWEFCYANKIFGTFGDEIKACGQKLVKFCTHAAKLVVRIGKVSQLTSARESVTGTGGGRLSLLHLRSSSLF